MEEALIRVKDLCKIYIPARMKCGRWIILIWKLIRVSLLLLSDSQVQESLTFMNMLGCLGCAYIRRIFSEWN